MMGIVQYRNSIQKTREVVLGADLVRMRDAIDQYYADKTKYLASLDALVTDGCLRKIPEDPMSKSTDTWQTEPAEPDSQRAHACVVRSLAPRHHSGHRRCRDVPGPPA